MKTRNLATNAPGMSVLNFSAPILLVLGLKTTDAASASLQNHEGRLLASRRE